ncbi:MAG: rod shape-determining protein MreD [Rhodospirillales bacterium]|nr:rod shape-determining protein MreD [Rhodospirillales bacterium]MCW8862766.1 rod shape-determining protein MreD [Rhodospirillales bacterium]MCW8952559.1 rod shape-determining protein MreD [Rhodospirillales bacterium]MCW8971491.1 rod shape-determining protein MreD [Rhodospirillales bacterium]MCW9002310.1 rod shape-determining protein MreD [Rhodospirillales bacterium]
MKQSVWYQLDRTARGLTPFALAVLMVMVAATPIHIPELARIMPAVALVAVYHWTLYRPELLPAPAVFVLGLFQDFLAGGPVGIGTLVLMGVYGALLGQRGFFYGKSFAVVWMGFVLVAAFAKFLSWMLLSAYYSMAVTPDAFFFQYLLTIMIFPPISAFLLRWQRNILRQE